MTNELFMRVLEENSPACFNAVAPIDRERMSVLTLAECLRPAGRYLPILEEDVRNAARLKTWIYPNNDDQKDNFEGRTIFNDLASVHLGANLVTMSRLLGDRRSPGVRELIRSEVKWRVLQLYEERIRSDRDLYWWFKVTHNWNSVCLGCVLICALERRETREQAWHLAVVERLIRYSEEGFPDDGFYTEDLGYWSYGFGHYILVAEFVRLVTAGPIDWLGQLLGETMVRFGERMEIQAGLNPAVADCVLDVAPFAWVANWLNGRQLDTPGRVRSTRIPVDAFDRVHGQFLPQTLLVLFGMIDAQRACKQESERSLRDWYNRVDYLICRPDDRADVPLGATFKGGDNGVNHNHNDLGTFTIAIGKRHLALDPGAEIYSSRTFSKDRYEGGLLNSYGHTVPRIAGQLQAPGQDAFATVLRSSFADDLDGVVLDLKLAYRVATLTQFERTFRYNRVERPWVEVIDEVAFSEPGTFETAVITLSAWEHREDGSVLIRQEDAALRLRVESGAGAPIFSHDLIDECTKPTRFAWTVPDPITRATVRIVAEAVD